jgi:hypothetical protein
MTYLVSTPKAALEICTLLYGTRVWWDGVTSNQKPMINRFDRARWFEDLV